ncbi:MAG: AAA family ATPase [Desulfobacterales bacterium]|nr:AAA family ATPase [Desulfobacterales bacterium]
MNEETHLSLNTKIIAVCGKGGVGKTCISALLTRLLSVDGKHKVLAIDADPAVGLSFALDMPVHKTVDDIRCEIIEKLHEQQDKQTLVNQLDYELLSALIEKQNLAFLAIGRPEQDGCYCQVNQLLKTIIHHLAHQFDYVIIDGEAGIEQINRRVMEMVTHLLLVADVSHKARHVALTIADVGKKIIAYQKIGLLFNRVQSDDDIHSILQTSSVPVIGWLNEDSCLREMDRLGKSVFSISDNRSITSLNQFIVSFL